MKNATGQILLLEKVDKLSQRSRFCGPDVNKVPDPSEGFRYKGAHLAMSVGSIEEYDEVYGRLESNGAYLEGDLRAAHRKPGEKSVYFYDPFGNRLQLIILPPTNS
jgi:catechol 2,3-dioxygenase-like lactoylglutathione lyase family enzyme